MVNGPANGVVLLRAQPDQHHERSEICPQNGNKISAQPLQGRCLTKNLYIIHNIQVESPATFHGVIGFICSGSAS